MIHIYLLIDKSLEELSINNSFLFSKLILKSLIGLNLGVSIPNFTILVKLMLLN